MTTPIKHCVRFVTVAGGFVAALLAGAQLSGGFAPTDPASGFVTCQSTAARDAAAHALENSPSGHTGLAILDYRDIRTDKTTPDREDCTATVKLNSAITTTAHYSFYRENGQDWAEVHLDAVQ